MTLPIHIINKILLYNIHPCAVLIKDYIIDKVILYADIIIKINTLRSFHFRKPLNAIEKVIITELFYYSLYSMYWYITNFK